MTFSNFSVENKKEARRVGGKKRSRYEEKTELMKRKTEEDEEFIGSLKTMFKRPGETSFFKTLKREVCKPVVLVIS